MEKMLEGDTRPCKDHNDIWSEIRRAAVAKGFDFAEVEYVKAHATGENVMEGKFTYAEWRWNTQADLLACWGAAKTGHAIPKLLKTILRRRKRLPS